MHQITVRMDTAASIRTDRCQGLTPVHRRGKALGMSGLKRFLGGDRFAIGSDALRHAAGTQREATSAPLR